MEGSRYRRRDLNPTGRENVRYVHLEARQDAIYECYTATVLVHVHLQGLSAVLGALRFRGIQKKGRTLQPKYL